MTFDNAGSTIMSILFGVAHKDDALRREQLERFASQYTQPLVDYLERSKRVDSLDAAEIVQEFWLVKLIQPNPEDNLVAKYLESLRNRLDDATDSFRRYLLRSISNHYLDSLRKRKLNVVSLEQLEGFDVVSDSDCNIFDSVWANSLLRQVVSRVRSECRANDQLAMWQLFCRQIVLPQLTNNGPPGYALLATEMGYSDARSAANAVRTVIRKFQSHMKSCISDYLPIKDITDSENRVEQEFSEILELLSKPGILDRELFDDVIGDGASKTEPDDSKSSFINLPEQSSNFLVGPEQSLYAKDEDIEFRWRQILAMPIAGWLESVGEPLEEPLDDRFKSLACGNFFSESVVLHIRNTAKKLARATGDEPPAILAAIYLLAIASGYTHHGQILSSDPKEKIQGRISQIIRYPWLDRNSKAFLSATAHAWN